MSSEKDYEEFKLRLNALREAAEYYFLKAPDDKIRWEIVRLLEDSIGKLTLNAARAGLDCPPNYIRCPDGSCVPEGMSCKGRGL